MKKIIFLITIFVTVMISACSNGNQSEKEQELPALLEVDLRLPEEGLEPKTDITLEAYVSQGGEAVEDANEVKFEVLIQGETQSEMYPGEHQGEGIYTATMQVEDEGIYSVTAHVTARDMHNMPKKEMIVGNPDITAGDQEDDHTDSHDESDLHGHGHEKDLVVDLQSGFDMKVNENTELTVLINEKGHSLTGAEVRFEIWSEGQDEHEFIDAAEAGDGVYKAKKTFEKTGNHLINVHVNKGDLHEHQLFSVTVN
ncbi:YtkA-like [Mesobacillus persicus]|uniref:YtkA-like n=1 Tax=Mesobacillus persicus TaxID=930146 RepID=A0A1H8CUP4_9BACI|nr:FixH family protein [Mesobacillus persicus]SEM98619.1 YtkA-like [Mesobacillus persicus]